MTDLRKFLKRRCEKWQLRVLEIERGGIPSDPDTSADAGALLELRRLSIVQEIAETALDDKASVRRMRDLFRSLRRRADDADRLLTAVGMPIEHPLRPAAILRLESTFTSLDPDVERRGKLVTEALMDLLRIYDDHIAKDAPKIGQWCKDYPKSPVSEAYEKQRNGVLSVCSRLGPRDNEWCAVEIVAILEGKAHDTIRRSNNAWKGVE